jgi:hypothetical protein
MVADGLEASWGPQLASQKLWRGGVVGGESGSSSDNRKWIQDSKVELGFEEKCNPKSIVDKMYFPASLTASMCPGLGQCMYEARNENVVARSGLVHICNQLIIPSQDCMFAISGALSSGDISMECIVSIGRPEQKGVIRGDLLAVDRPISSAIAAA